VNSQLRIVPITLLVGVLGLAFGADAAQKPAGAAAGPAISVSNAIPAGLSVFVIPGTPPEGKDPFFPKSLRVYTTGAASTNRVVTAPPQTVELKINGISGTAEHPLAIINGKTFEQGEEGEVRVGAARMNIRVLEIKANTVTVQVGTRQQVLRMRGGF